MKGIDRRLFLEEMLLAGAAAATPLTAAVAAEAETPGKSANEKLSVAVIGVRGRGGDHARVFAARDDCQVTYVCDADKKIGAARAEQISGEQGRPVKFVADMREIFDDQSVDVVSIATPNHWHSLAAIWAMQADKDVYVEKPVSHNVSEGRRMVQAARKHHRICQGGTQYRSNGSNRAAARYIAEGKLGKVKLVKVYTYQIRKSIGPPGEYPVPPEIDYNLWAGPAPMEFPVRRRNFHYDWHWFWNYGNGEIGNNSIHRVDAARLMTGLTGLGRGAISYGARLGLDDAAETPNTQVTIHDFGGVTLVQEVRNLTSPGPRYGGSILIAGTEAYIVGNLTSNTVHDFDGKEIEKLTGPNDDHFANFIKAVRSRNREDQNAEILEGHVSTGLVHVANVSQRLGRPAPPEEIAKQLDKLKTNEKAVETFELTRKYLADNDIDIEKTPLTLGPRLAIDPETETFVDNPAADALLTRDYREPFVVPAESEI